MIAMPTDTLYALVADATDDEAVDKIYAIKSREMGKPLPLLVADLKSATEVAIFNQTASHLAAKFWPGALTIVLAKQPSFDSHALAGGTTVALRIPHQHTALAIIRKLGHPVTGTSANLSGGPDPNLAEETTRQLGDAIDFVVDFAGSTAGRSSTIIDCTGEDLNILRYGAISDAEIETALAELEIRSSD